MNWGFKRDSEAEADEESPEDSVHDRRSRSDKFWEHDFVRPLRKFRDAVRRGRDAGVLLAYDYVYGEYKLDNKKRAKNKKKNK